MGAWGCPPLPAPIPWPKRCLPWGAREQLGRDGVGCPQFWSLRRGPVALGICSTHHNAWVGVGRICPIRFISCPSVGFFQGKQSQQAALVLEISMSVGRGMPGPAWAGVLPAWVPWVRAPRAWSSWGTPWQEAPPRVNVARSDAAGASLVPVPFPGHPDGQDRLVGWDLCQPWH